MCDKLSNRMLGLILLDLTAKLAYSSLPAMVGLLGYCSCLWREIDVVASSQTGLSFGRLGHVVTLWRFSCNKCMSCERFCRLIRGLTYLLSRVVAPLVYQLIKICFIGLTCCISVFTSLLKGGQTHP